MKRIPQEKDTVQRESFIAIIRAAMRVNQFRYIQQMTSNWLSTYPNDLFFAFYKALALLSGEQPHLQEAQKILEEICERDAEFLEAQKLLATVYRALNHEKAKGVEVCIAALSGENLTEAPMWASALWQARKALQENKLEDAEKQMRDAFTVEAIIQEQQNQLASLLVALTNLEILHQQSKKQSTTADPSLLSLADYYHQRWQKSVVFKLIFADSLMNGGRSDEAVALLHQAVTEDTGGEIVERLFGIAHPYQSLWYKDISIKLDTAMPASVAASLGWNRLSGERLSNESIVNADSKTPDYADTIDKAESDLEEVPHEELLITLDEIAKNLRQPSLSKSDARFPVYFVWSAKQPLIKQYGKEGFREINETLTQLTSVIDQHPGWNARLLYADDAQSTALHGIKPVLAKDAWALKLSLVDLDKALEKKGEMIGALLIVGGSEIIPYHNLPNPVDDPDSEVPSDNPYASRDENYFVPEWSVGRISGGSTSDVSTLVKILQTIRTSHQQKNEVKPWYLRLLEAVFGWFSPSQQQRKKSLGYTAAIWKEASLAVFKPIGEVADLLVSPPIDSFSFANGKFSSAQLAYFNLHGVEDAPNWYGQRDPMEGIVESNGLSRSISDEDYPIALRPENLNEKIQTPEFVFSEACYGAHILSKTIDEALSLKFISIGTKAVVGSTSTAYGSVTTPLTAADLLGRYYWQYLNEGLCAGMALKQAKIELAKEMSQRQGYLDGEDQKTLIQFILIGDPLAQLNSPSRKQRRGKKSEVLRSTESTLINTVQEQVKEEGMFTIAPETIQTVKDAVAKYLPGMADSKLNVSQIFPEVTQFSNKPLSSKPTAKVFALEKLPYQVITLRKQVEAKSIQHQHIARFTIDEEGEVIKMTVSR